MVGGGVTSSTMPTLDEMESLSAEEAGMRIASQMPLAEKLPYASLVIDNNGNIDDLKKKVKGAIKDLANLV